MPETILITGAGGFAGRYMCRYLRSLQLKCQVVGVDLQEDTGNQCDKHYVADISDVEQVKEIIEKTCPRYIIHLAGTFGLGDTQQIYRVNVFSMTAILESVLEYVPDSIVIAAGSAAEYGKVDAEQLPVKETIPCQPVTTYGLSKLLATQVSLYYHRVHSLNVMIVRPFQLIGKGVTARLAPGAFAEQLKKTISNGSNVIKVGNLESSRDFLDVHDAVEAIWLLCQNPKPGGIFNICSGISTRIGDLLKIIIKESGAKVKVDIDPARLRGNADTDKIYGSYQKIHQYCGWSPKIPLVESVRVMLKESE